MSDVGETDVGPTDAPDTPTTPPDAEAPAEASGSPAATATAVCGYLVRQLVNDPDAVRVDAVRRATGVQLEVRVARGDIGRVIGKRGRTAHAIRTVTRAAGAKDGVDVSVEFLE